MAVLRGPSRSHNLPMSRRAMMVEETDAIMVLPTCAFDNPRSARIAGIRGARPNQPKKQTKNMSQVMWKVRICTVLREKRRMRSRGPADAAAVNGVGILFFISVSFIWSGNQVLYLIAG